MAVPRVVPRPNDFNNLQCQTSLTALPSAKDIFLDCQTGAVTTPKQHTAVRTGEAQTHSKAGGSSCIRFSPWLRRPRGREWSKTQWGPWPELCYRCRRTLQKCASAHLGSDVIQIIGRFGSSTVGRLIPSDPSPSRLQSFATAYCWDCRGRPSSTQ
jgi:hypothetical protein